MVQVIQKCESCGAITSTIETTTHPYINASPGCWEVYCRVLGKEYSFPEFRAVHRLTVDAYACQHIGGSDRRAVQSATVHLLGLYFALVKNIPFEAIPRYLEKAILHRPFGFRQLVQPDFRTVLKVTEVALAINAETHCQLVKSWAKDVWQSWDYEHDYVKKFAEQLIS